MLVLLWYAPRNSSSVVTEIHTIIGKPCFWIIQKSVLRLFTALSFRKSAQGGQYSRQVRGLDRLSYKVRLFVAINHILCMIHDDLQHQQHYQIRADGRGLVRRTLLPLAPYSTKSNFRRHWKRRERIRYNLLLLCPPTFFDLPPFLCVYSKQKLSQPLFWF